MPIYEYACRSCEHRLETIQKASEDPLRDCPSCGQPALKKLLSAPVFRFKGTGWYETDFKTGDKKNVSDTADVRDNGESGGKTEGESKAKPAPAGSEKNVAGSSSKDKPSGKEAGAQTPSGSGSSKAADAS